MRKQLQSFSTNQIILWLLVCASLFVFSARIFLLIRKYAVNIMFVDVWDVFNPIFNGEGIVRIFSMQYGPHRQGVGGLIIWAVSSLTHWNTKADAYMTLVLVFLACVVALAIKRLVFGKWILADLIIPVIFLTVSQFETFIITPNEAHSSFPLLGVSLFGLALLIRNRVMRSLCLILIDFVTMFTGFGVFIGVMTPLVLIIDLYKWIIEKNHQAILVNLATLLASFLVAGSFFYNYTFAPTVSCFQVIPSYIPRYPAFMAVILSRFLGVNYSASVWLSVIAGAALLLSLLAVFILSAIKLVFKQDSSPIKQVIFAFSGFSIFFLANAAVGRMCLGMEMAYTSRYVTLTLPGIFAIYLYLLLLKKSIWQSGLFFAFLLIISISIPVKAQDINTLSYFTTGKMNWRECYLKIEDVEKCNAQTNFWVFPPPSMMSQPGTDAFYKKLEYLKAHKLNFYYRIP